MKTTTNLGIVLAVFAIGFGPAIAPAQTIVRENVATSGFQARTGVGSCGNAENQCISGDGRWVVFVSSADNLIASVGGSCLVYVKDTTSGALELASVDSSGASIGGVNSTPTCSTDARWIVFASRSSTVSQSALEQVILRDRSVGSTRCISTDAGGAPANGFCVTPEVSPDGRFVVYMSRGDNLVAGDTNGFGDIFLFDASNGSTQRVSLDANGAELDSESQWGSLTPDGRFLVFSTASAILAASDLNGLMDVYHRDLQTGAVTLVSVDPNGISGNSYSVVPTISSDGSIVAFCSAATNLAAGKTTSNTLDVYVRDLNSSSTACLSLDSSGHADGAVFMVDISRDGRWVCFVSGSPALDTIPNGWADVFLFDRTNNARIEITNPMPNGQASDGSSLSARFDDAAQRMVIQSSATGLVPGDRNGVDTYRWELAASTPTTTYCTGKVNSNGCAPAIYSNGEPSLSNEFYIGAVDIAWNGIGNGYPGLMIYSVTGRASVPFSGGTLCVAAPIQRAPATLSLSYYVSWSGPCKGAIAINMNAFAFGQAGGHPIPELVQLGTTVDCQWWLRDAAGGVQLSNALEYVVAP